MYPEDRVLVGVINRKRDLECVLNDHWYRIPQDQMPKGVNAEYLGFFLSRAFGERNGGIYYFAERKGIELLQRKVLLPDELNHRHAERNYYKVQLGKVREKSPPVLNDSRRAISFIYTTWDRFVRASRIKDLYSKEDYFVDRIYHALRNKGVAPERTWGAEYPQVAPQIRILCQNGTVTGSTDPKAGDVFLDTSRSDDEILNSILLKIAQHNGPVTLRIPTDGIYLT
ncbi:MAG: hypothetical protein R3E39_02190 [Anaerolineae bacterium]